jgi:RND family efflux transporter MFP subunit
MEPRLPRRLAVLATVLGSALGCEETRAAPPPPSRAVPVQIMAAHTAPVEDASEYVATMDSRRAVELLPQVDGRITRVLVKSGEKVAQGAPIVEIDPREQQAAVAGAEEQRRAAEANLAFARRQFQRSQRLFASATISQQELDQARTNLDSAAANLAALSSRVKAARVQLKYYTVTAPFDGVVGDVRARIGDRVGTETPITTIDEIHRLQIYVYVPSEQSPRLRLGLPVSILDAQGKVIDTAAVDFVSPRVDRDTQTVLVKASVTNETGALRQAEAVRARVVFGTEEHLVVPVTAVTRLGAQTFVFVAERQPQGLVARRRPIQTGGISGNDHVVLGGIAAGDLVIVSGTQKLADGAPVEPQKPEPRPAQPEPPQR